MSGLSFAEVGEILRLLRDIDGADIELEWGDLKIQVRRGGGAEPAPAEVTAAPAEVTVQAVPAVPDRNAEAVPDHWVSVAAPMAGTFYRAPKPDEPPFVEVGDLVSAGQPVALVEVMKLFTELKADVAGKVARIDAAEASLVEFDQPLIWIEPA